MPAGARAQALGGAVSAGVEGSEALFWNPAGLARLEAEAPADLSLSYNALLESAYSGTVAYARPIGRDNVLAVGLVYFSQSALTSYNGQGDPTGSFAPNDLALSGAVAHRFGETWQAGAGLKLIRSSLAEVTGVTVALDAGLQARHLAVAGDGAVDVGAGISNLGPALKLGSAAALPFVMRAGILWHMTPIISPSFDLNFPVDQDPFVSIGVEGRLKFSEKSGAKGPRQAALRVGYNQNQGRDVEGTLAGVTAGAGLDLGAFRIDYAWVPFGDLGMTNRISLAFRL